MNALEEFITTKCKRGSVFSVGVEFTTPPKEKFVVVWGVDESIDKVGVTCINSNINHYIFPTPALKELHLLLSANDYSFLSHDSYLDCSDINEISLRDLMETHLGDKDVYVGNLGKTDLSLAYKKLASAPTVRTKHKKRYNI